MKKIVVFLLLCVVLSFTALIGQDENDTVTFHSAKDTLLNDEDYYVPREIELEIEEKESKNGIYYLIGGLLVVGIAVVVFLKNKANQKK